jgi:hypothetical protein
LFLGTPSFGEVDAIRPFTECAAMAQGRILVPTLNGPILGSQASPADGLRFSGADDSF